MVSSKGSRSAFATAENALHRPSLNSAMYSCCGILNVVFPSSQYELIPHLLEDEISGDAHGTAQKSGAFAGIGFDRSDPIRIVCAVSSNAFANASVLRSRCASSRSSDETSAGLLLDYRAPWTSFNPYIEECPRKRVNSSSAILNSFGNIR